MRGKLDELLRMIKEQAILKDDGDLWIEIDEDTLRETILSWAELFDD